MVEEIKDKKVKSEKIEVDRETLEEVLSKIKNLEKSREDDARIIGTLKEDNAMLLGIADKKRLADYEIRNNKGTLSKIVKVWMLNDKFVVGWKMITNRVVANLHRNMVEAEQTIKVFLQKAGAGPDEKNEEIILLYKEFIDSKVSIQGEVIKAISDEDNTVYRVQFEDGREVDVDVKFIN